jgi:hypothetical protein
MGRVARQISTWTTNCLLTGILIVVSLGFGRQVMVWWSVPEAAATSAANVAPPGLALNDALQGQLIRFGNQKWSIRRKAVAGRDEDAARALLAECRERIPQAAAPTDPPDAAEQGLLARLAREKPAAESPGQWQLYAWEKGCPMAVGVRQFAPASGSVSGKTLAERGHRVVIWGVAAPAAAVDRWTLWLFHPDGGGNSSVGGLPSPPIPPECQRILSVQADRGQSLVVFSGSEPLGRYEDFYRGWFAQQGWKAAADHPSAGAGRHLQYVARGRNPAVAADVHLSVDAGGRCTGWLMTFELER